MAGTLRARAGLAAGLTTILLGPPAYVAGQSPSSQSPSGQVPVQGAPATPGSPSSSGQVEPGAAAPDGGATPPGSAPSAAPEAGSAPPAAATPPAADAADVAADNANLALSSGLGGGAGGTGAGYFQMLGDQPPIARTFAIPRPPNLPSPGIPPIPTRFPSFRNRAVAVLPSVRSFKIAENQSPRPQDRIYYSFNYFDNLNQSVNARLGSPISNLKAYRYVLGFEKTVLDGRASVGMRLPINSLTTTSSVAGLGGTNHAAGDLAAIFKYALIDDRDAGRLISAGLLVSAPTGPRNFAGTPGLRSPHNAALQPFLGFIQTYGDLYIQGFSAVDVPMNPNDVTFYYNDIGIGYFLYRANDPDQFISAIAPTYEVHVNTPLNHRDPYNVRDLAGSYDFVDFTFGVNFQVRRRGILSLAIVEPVTGPRPYTLETLLQFNLRF